MWNWKGPYYIRDKETPMQMMEAKAAIAEINHSRVLEREWQNHEWESSTEFAELKKKELAHMRCLRAQAKKHCEKIDIEQHWRRKKFKADKLGGMKGVRGIDAWRYVKHVAEPKLWLACKERLKENPNFKLMEDGAWAHISWFTNGLREKQGIPKVDWPLKSPDFNSFKHIWDWMHERIIS
ncbi:hypothetical protein HOY80DRAFT_1077334 [Tuber brumale]|nr:hypothetical protein HOY80DRAFT_1077334 [Tuber brumale]